MPRLGTAEPANAAPLKLLLALNETEQSTLCRDLDITPTWLAKLCNGRAKPSAKLAARIAEYLGVDDPSMLFADPDGDSDDIRILMFVRRTRRESAVPETIEDAAVAEQVAAILRGGDAA